MISCISSQTPSEELKAACLDVSRESLNQALTWLASASQLHPVPSDHPLYVLTHVSFPSPHISIFFSAQRLRGVKSSFWKQCLRDLSHREACKPCQSHLWAVMAVCERGTRISVAGGRRTYRTQKRSMGTDWEEGGKKEREWFTNLLIVRKTWSPSFMYSPHTFFLQCMFPSHTTVKAKLWQFIQIHGSWTRHVF